MFTRRILPLIAVAMFGLAIYQVVASNPVKEKVVPSVTPPLAPYRDGVAGAGIVEPETENISIGSPLPGIVTQVKVKVGDSVQVGDLLFALDDRALKAEQKMREANLASARAQLERLENQPRQEELPPSEARVAEARANLVNLEDQARRAEALASRQVINEEELVTRKQTARVAREQLARAEADLRLLRAGAWSYDKDVSQAAVELAQAQLEQTETELMRLQVKALVAGKVLQVNVRPGEFVGAPPGQALIVLGATDKLHVRVDIDECDIPRMKLGSRATAMLRGDPSQQFALKFVRVEPYVIPKKSLTGQNTERVDTRVLQVIYALESSRSPLYVGQQVDVFVQGDGQ